jgi:hypothetical protein
MTGEAKQVLVKHKRDGFDYLSFFVDVTIATSFAMLLLRDGGGGTKELH